MRLLHALPVAALLTIHAGHAEPAEASLRVTTDSAEYCETLATRLAGMPTAAAPLPQALGQEGRRLCATGHLRTGIAKLRRAIRLANEARAGA
ncbi:hypothetical protein ACI6QG_09315 [Roseococcus sp. DSY-14]|uniref:hypothetical protein n=1 Tax=Roseococcus sp. DSY-14 TaxID=3369650 RepID=UPI00387B6477